MKPKILTVVAVVFLVQFGFFPKSVSFAETLKEGWNESALAAMTAGCVYSIEAPQIATLKEKTGYTREGVPPEFEKKFKNFDGQVKEMCRCITNLTAQKWPLIEAQKMTDNNPERAEFLKQAFCTKQCRLPFDAPIDCSSKEKPMVNQRQDRPDDRSGL